MKLRTIIFILVIAVIGLSIAGVISLPSIWNSIVGETEPPETVTLERVVDASEFTNLKIDWAAGSIRLVTGNTDKITIQETKNVGNTHDMVTEYNGKNLTIRYASGISANMANLSAKDLTIIVPQDWVCQKLEITGAALDTTASGLNAQVVKLSGAATKLQYTGTIQELECDGAAAQISLNCDNAPQEVDINGAACKLSLMLPASTGFTVSTEGVAVDFNSDAACTFSNNTYTHGDGSCKVKISGLGCTVSVNHNK